MAQYRDLNAPPQQTFAEIVAAMQDQAKSSKTGASGVKDLGASGDVVWPRPDGTAVSVRDVDLDLADARQRIEDAEGTLAGAQARIDTALDAEGHIREDEILRNATLLGETVVQEINVTGKLIGTDGVFTGTVDFANVNVTGTQIVNKLGANSISADKISGGSFAGNQFTGGSFEGTAFRGGSFVGGIYATHPNPDQVGGVMIDDNWGMRGWDSDGNQTFRLSKATGTLRLSANAYLTDPTTGNGLVLAPRSSEGSSHIYFSEGGTTAGTQAAIWRNDYSGGRTPLELRGANGSGIRVHNGLLVDSGSLEAGGAAFSGNVTGVDVYATGRLLAKGAPSTSASANTYMVSPSHSTWTEGGRLYISTSSRRYKRNIVDWSPDAERVLAMRPRQWQHSDPESPIDERWHVGFIAEEIHDLGLRGLVRYEVSPEGDYRPEGLNYDRFAAAQQTVLRKHEDEINELRERIALLEQNQEPQ